MSHDPRKYLCDMQDRAKFVVEVLENRTCNDLHNDRLLRSAVERELMALGEALIQLHRVNPEIAERIDKWNDIMGFRHVLVHGYDILDMEIIWDVVKDDLPQLIEQLDSMLSDKL